MAEGKLVIFELVTEPASEIQPDGRLVRTRTLRDKAVEAVEVSVDTMREGMASFLDGVSRMLELAEKAAGAYAVETVEVQCQVRGDGKVGFAGTGISLQGQSSMKLVFKRKPA